jgi:hypothetical protein
MGSVANPMFSGIVPGGMNPTGNQLSLLDLPGSESKGANPLLPQTTPGSLSTPVNTNPYGVVPGSTTSAPPAFPANSGPSSPSGILSGTGLTSTTGGNVSGVLGTGQLSQQDWTGIWRNLSKTYGSQMAGLLVDFLRGGAGFSPDALNALFASLQPQIERGEEDLMTQFSASGNRFGSGAQIGLGDFLSQVNLNEGEIAAKMQEDAITRFLDVLTGTSSAVASTKANSPSGLDSILGGIGLGGQAAGGASAAISGFNPGADTSILDAIAGAAAFA